MQIGSELVHLSECSLWSRYCRYTIVKIASNGREKKIRRLKTHLSSQEALKNKNYRTKKVLQKITAENF